MQEYGNFLPRIKSPLDLKSLSTLELNSLAAEIRDLIVRTVSRNGGHLASNLGVVELTIALHCVFNSPKDKIVWDVGHQCYTHKILTGRYEQFSLLRKSGGIAGFPKISESPHDSFNTGHASTSISAALGMLAAGRLSGDESSVAALIGDGALTGGLAYEALCHAGQLQLPLIVILNDNKMSIGPNVGGLSKYLSRLSMKSKYQTFRRAVDSSVKKIPFAGWPLYKIMLRLKRAVKAIFYTDHFFVDLGFEYVGPIEGHNILLLTRVIRDAKKLNKPVVIHVMTRKGKGYHFAEKDPGTYHGVQAFQVSRGLEKREAARPRAEEALPENVEARPQKADNRGAKTFTEVFANALLEAGRKDERVTAVTAAMEEGTGLFRFREMFPERFFDTGIAEGHAVTFAAGIAGAGFRPVAAVYSTFIQRAFDQVIHDVCLQNLPVVFALDRSGFVSDDGETHQGIYDISLFRSVPNISILAPAGEEEFVNMLNWAITSGGPVVIRYPKALCPAGAAEFSLPLEKGRGGWIKRRDGNSLCIIFTGSLYPQVMGAASVLSARGIEADLYNIRFIKPLDEDYLVSVMSRYKAVLFAEEGTIAGGIGEEAALLLLRRNCRTRFFVLGAKENFDALGKRDELLARNGLDSEGIAAAAERLFTKGAPSASAEAFKTDFHI